MASGPAGADDSTAALTTFAAAKVVIGQKNFKGSECNRNGSHPSANTICEAEGAPAVGKKVLYVPDSANNRVLGFKTVPKKNGASAKFVLGQPNFTAMTEGLSQSKLNFPGRVLVAGNQLFVIDFSNSRVLIWNKLPTKTGTPADVVVGQPDFNSNSSMTTRSSLDHPEDGLAVANGMLFVADRNNSRIMIWKTIPTTNGADADLVLGQPDFSSNAATTTQSGLSELEGLWTDGTRLAVADFMNNRVLIWKTIPTADNTPADVVVGQPDFNSFDDSSPPTAQSLSQPGDVASDGNRLFVEDSRNNRILVYSPFPTANNPTAMVVLGQQDFTHNDANAGNSVPSARTMSFPFGMSLVGKQLFVTDYSSSRFLIFNNP